MISPPPRPIIRASGFQDTQWILESPMNLHTVSYFSSVHTLKEKFNFKLNKNNSKELAIKANKN